MTDMRVLAIDQGTSSTKAILVDGAGAILARASCALETHYPQAGWAEQSAADIWHSVQQVIAEISGQTGQIDAIAIANQRETLVVWDAQTSLPICPAILWQCRRTAADCAALMNHNAAVIDATGLGINPLFPASKLAWVMRNIPRAAPLLAAGQLRAGTVDAWLLWQLTGGAVFATDHSNAARTQLFDTQTLRFCDDLAAIFSAPLDCLPRPMPSDSHFGATALGSTALPAGVPIRAMMGDSHAALYGHGIRQAGTAKATYGTGSSLMTLTPQRIASSHGLSGTIAWSAQNQVHYAIEGNITVSAQAAAFMAQLLGLADAAALSDLAQTVPDAGGVTFVPALAGLGAPHWDDSATGLITGMTHATTPAHLARATFQAIALQVADVFGAMQQDIGNALHSLHADGGASGNPFLMQMQADILGKPVICSAAQEVGAMGAAAMAFAALGVQVHAQTASNTAFAPRAFSADLNTGWTRAIAKARLNR